MNLTEARIVELVKLGIAEYIEGAKPATELAEFDYAHWRWPNRPLARYVEWWSNDPRYARLVPPPRDGEIGDIWYGAYYNG